MTKYLAFDIGASSGRAIVGILDNENLKLDEIYRFPNGGIRVFNSFYWDTLNIYKEMLNGLRKYSYKYGESIDGIGVDNWGVDFVLLDINDEPVGLNHHYRDNRTEGILNEMYKLIPKEEIFSQTGIQFMQINSSTQLFSMVHNKSPQLSIARTFLMMPDFLNFLLSGKKVSEYSIASTSQLFNPITNNWAFDLIKKLKLKPEWFCNIVPPGTILGNVQDYISKEINIKKNTEIIAPACHDTGSAIAACPVDMKNYNEREWAYLSSGTWSLMGIELRKPLINEKVLNHNFTNEGGVEGTIRFLKNITGLWIIQECKRIWNKKELNLTWEKIMKKAENSPAFKNFINPDDPKFLNPPNMIDAIKHYCEEHSQKPPETIGEISRTTIEGLSFRYKQTLESLEDILKTKVKVLHIIGGGSQNKLLNQFTANVLNIPIEAGPVEATAIGNLLMQAYARKEIKSLKNLRNIVRNSFQIKKYEPINVLDWQQAYNSYLKCISN